MTLLEMTVTVSGTTEYRPSVTAVREWNVTSIVDGWSFAKYRMVKFNIEHPL